jgi:murein L,D-transpeptidase YcbB/YkuD
MRLKIVSIFFTVFLIFIHSSCVNSCNGKNKRKAISADQSLYSPINYNLIFLDSAKIAHVFQEDSSLAEFAPEMRDFYLKREYQFAWFNEDGVSTSLAQLYQMINLHILNFQDSTLYDKVLMPVIDSLTADPKYLKKNMHQQVDWEVKFTGYFFKFAKKEFNGIDKDPKDLEWFIPRKKKDFKLLLEKIACCEKEMEEYEPVNPFYKNFKKSLIEYRQIADSADSLQIFAHKLKNDKESLPQIKNLLYLMKDLPTRDTSEEWSEELSTAIENFQMRMGLHPNCELDAPTLAELNVPIIDRIKQIIINMERLRWMPDSVSNDYILVNIASFTFYVFEQGKLVWQMPVVVGKSATSTTIFSGSLSHIVFSPYWNIPKSILVNEILPKVKRNPSYIDKHNMQVLIGNQVISAYSIPWNNYSDKVPLTVRQKPGPENALGQVKFLFPNAYNIYFHDTPQKNLFKEHNRAFSHGCIRLSDPSRLARYLLRDSPEYTNEKLESLMQNNLETWVKLKTNIPVYLCYFTAWRYSDGSTQFRRDIYNHDKKLEKEVFSNYLF